MRRERNPKYVAAGAHEYGHAQIASTSKYPRARVIGNTLPHLSDIAGAGAGLLAQRHLGRLGGSLVGGAVSGVTHVPTLIEEHSASKRALKALREEGELNATEYQEAKVMLDDAYKTYVNKALGSISTSAGISGGHAGLVTAGVSSRKAANDRARGILSQVRGSDRDARHARIIGKRMGQGRVRQTYGDGAMYIAPHAHVRSVYKDRSQYLKALRRSGIQLDSRDLDHGAIMLPRYEKRAGFLIES